MVLDSFLKQVTSVVVSEYNEAICSLHVLSRPEHHTYRVKWAEHTSKRLSGAFLRELKDLSALTNDWLAMIQIHPVTEGGGSFQEGLKVLQQLPDLEFLVQLFNDRYTLGESATWQANPSASDAPPMTVLERTALSRPAWIRRRMVEFLQTYYRLYFEAEWHRV